MVGNVWNHIPNFTHWANCPICNTTESMEHILTQCEADTNCIIWHLAEETWPHNNTPWLEISFSLIIGVGCLNNTNDNPQNPAERNPHTIATQKANTRLLQILISKSAHLIWVLRCERIIQEKTHTDEEVKVRWLRKINERLTIDRIVTMKIVRNKTYTKLIKNIWKRALQRQNDLPVDWLNNCEVLVGSGQWDTNKSTFKSHTTMQ